MSAIRYGEITPDPPQPPRPQPRALQPAPQPQRRPPVVRIRPARDRMMTGPQIAEELNVSRMTVYRLLHSGDIESVRVGRSFRVRRSVFEAWLAAGGSPEPDA